MKLKIYNVLGKLVANVINDFQNPGSYSIIWEAMDHYNNPLPSGVYIVKIQSGNQIQTIKISLIK